MKTAREGDPTERGIRGQRAGLILGGEGDKCSEQPASSPAACLSRADRQLLSDSTWQQFYFPTHLPKLREATW